MTRVRHGLALVLALAACGPDGSGDTTGPTPEPVVTTLTLSPDSVVFHDPGETSQFTLIARDASRSVIPGVTAQWSSSDTSVVKISPAGVAAAGGEGSATVTASVESVSGSASVVVTFRWSSVAPGSLHACALRGGRPYCWGAPTTGQLSDPGSGGDVSGPQGVETDVSFVALDAGERHTCGLTADGDMYCWGQNTLGQLGTGVDAEADAPVPVAGGLKFASMSLGDYHTCALTAEGIAYCWGGGGVPVDGRDLAMGHQPEDFCSAGSYFSTRCTKTPRPVSGSIRFEQISAGLFHSCGVDGGGVAYCWGWNRGQLGNGESSITDPIVPKGYDTPIPLLGGQSFEQVSAGNLHSCGVTASGSAMCWGATTWNQGQLGTGAFDPALEPTPVPGLTGLVSIEATKENSVYAANTCAVGGDGTAWCWGADAEGQLGTAVAMEECTKAGEPAPCTSTPLPVDGGLSFASVQSGLEFACGLTADGELYCWGANDRGQLGNGTFDSSRTPVRVLDPA